MCRKVAIDPDLVVCVCVCVCVQMRAGAHHLSSFCCILSPHLSSWNVKCKCEPVRCVVSQCTQSTHSLIQRCAVLCYAICCAMIVCRIYFLAVDDRIVCARVYARGVQGSVVTVTDTGTSCMQCDEGTFHAAGFVLDQSDFVKEVSACTSWCAFLCRCSETKSRQARWTL